MQSQVDEKPSHEVRNINIINIITSYIICSTFPLLKNIFYTLNVSTILDFVLTKMCVFRVEN